MNQALVFVGVVACLVSCVIVGAEEEECEKYMPQMIDGYIKNAGAIECYKELGLDKFDCEEGDHGDEEKIKQKQEEFKNWLEEPEQKDRRKEIVECIMKVAEKTVADLGEEVPENCKKSAIEQMHANWHIEE